jgi:heptosyltransferase-2
MAVAVVQPLPGIGDMIWHLPHLRAIAAHVGEPVTLIAKPRSLADELLAGEPAIREILWLDLNPNGALGRHDGWRGFLRLTRELRSRRFGKIILLHHSHTLAAAAFFAGIPDRSGYGWGAQKLLLSHGPFLPPDVARLHQHTRATRFLEAASIQLVSAEPHVPVPPAEMETVRQRLIAVPRPFVAIGIGSSETSRQAGATRLAELASALLGEGWPAVILLGGPGDQTLETAIRDAMGEDGHRAFPALGWPLLQAAALLNQAAFYVGNNTGVMNLAAATGVRTYALFGTTPPFFHASQIVPILSPPGGPDDGMVRMTTASVLDAIRADRGTLSPPVTMDVTADQASARA